MSDSVCADSTSTDCTSVSGEGSTESKQRACEQQINVIEHRGLSAARACLRSVRASLTFGLNSHVEFHFRRMRDAVPNEIHLLVLSQHVAKRVAQGVILTEHYECGYTVLGVG